MKYSLEITDSAALDLVGISEYIAKESVSKAYAYHDDVMAKLKNLENEPFIGRPHTVKKFLKAGYRELIILSHIAHYKVNEAKKQVSIIRVLHQSMNQAKHLK